MEMANVEISNKFENKIPFLFARINKRQQTIFKKQN